MPNLLWNPHSSNVRGLCTVFIMIILGDDHYTLSH